MTYSPHPSELAKFDQAFAEVNTRLDRFIEAHRKAMVEAADTREVDIAGLGIFIHESVDHDAASELLAVAIDRLAHVRANTGSEEAPT